MAHPTMAAKPPLPPIVHWRAPQLLGMAMALAFGAALVLEQSFSTRFVLLASWDVGALCYLGLSWLLIHTLFAFHYARLYYFLSEGGDQHHRGLKFPNDDDEPDYLDFAYYSFVVGMTSQVSDIAVLSRPMRRLTLIHGVLSFIYNIAILAMSINIIGGVI